MLATNLLKNILVEALLPLGYQMPEKTVIEPPRDLRHGDLATNLPMVLAKQAGLSPRDLALSLAQSLNQQQGHALAAEVAGPGFLNITFSPEFWQNLVLDVEKLGKDFGRTNAGQGKKVLVEYVSANPTGPLHIGHGRGAAVGDALARVMRFAGYNVSTEYYINDAGRQMMLLGLSVWLRLREAAGKDVVFPEDYYKGSYVCDIARALLKKRPELVDMDEEQSRAICFDYGVNEILTGIKKDLTDFRVEHQIWFSEKSLVEQNLVEQTLDGLKERGLAYEQDGALWFASTQFGDDKERVLRKSSGDLTYFASDIAYHDNKYRRGFELAIDVWGADHHGYIPRMRGAVQALGHNPDDALHVVLIQLVNLLRDGQQVAMSTRSGEFVTLAEVVAEVGVDAARFMFLSRKSDSPLDFDLELVKQRNMDNPVYYVQYAHARVQTLLRRAAERGVEMPPATRVSLGPLHGSDELALLRMLDQFADYVNAGAQGRTPHTVSTYLQELSGKLHSYYANHQVLGADDPALILARLQLLRAVGRVLANGLELLGVEAPASM